MFLPDDVNLRALHGGKIEIMYPGSETKYILLPNGNTVVKYSSGTTEIVGERGELLAVISVVEGMRGITFIPWGEGGYMQKFTKNGKRMFIDRCGNISFIEGF